MPDPVNTPFYFFLHLLQITVFIVLLRYLDLYEREPFPVILAMFAWGGIGATFLSLQGNAAVAELIPETVDAVFGAAIAAPLVEESAKGLALLVAFVGAHLMSRRLGMVGFQGVADGIVYGAAVGFGFAFTENIFFFLNFAVRSGSLQGGLEVFLLRVDFLGVGSLLHALFTGIFGAGLGLATWSRSWAAKIGYPVLGLAGAMFTHAAWNGLRQLLLVRQFGFETVATAFSTGRLPAQIARDFEAALNTADTVTRWVFYLCLLAAAAGFALWLRYERQVIRYELAEEVNAGLLTREEWEFLPRFWRRTRWYVALLRQGRAPQLSALSQLHDKLVHLALLKWRTRRIGGDVWPVNQLRHQVVALRAYAAALGNLGHPAAAAPSTVAQASYPASAGGGAPQH